MATPSRLVRILLHLLPRAFRAKFGADIAEMIVQSRADDRRERGRAAAWRRTAREIVALTGLALNLRRHSRHRAAGDDEPRSGTRGLSDLRGAWRYVSRHRAASFAVVVTLSAAFAATLTTTAMARAVLWRPLPFADADRLVFVWELTDRDGVPAPSRVTTARYAAWREADSSLDGLELFGAAGLTLDTADGRVPIRGLRVSAGYFDVLGARSLLGHTFAPADSDAAVVPIVLSHRLWISQFGGRPEVVGQTIRFSDAVYHVIGVMPAMVSPGWPSNPATVSLDPDTQQFWVVLSHAQLRSNTRSHVYGAIGRLARGRTVEMATRELMRTSTPEAIDPHGAWITPLRGQFVRDARQPLLLLVLAAVAVLLISGANLTALQASAFERRRGEFSVRAALGAGRVRLVRQLVVEALLLCALAGVVALAVVRAVLAWLPSRLPTSIPLLTTPALDWTVIAATVALVSVATVVLSAWPVGRLAWASPAPRGMAIRGRTPFYRAMVVGQIAATVALVAASALLGESLRHVYGQHAGFTIDRLLVADVGLPLDIAKSPAGLTSTFDDITRVVRSLPGVEAVATAYDHPLEANWTAAFELTGEPGRVADTPREAELRIVSPSYFATAGTTVVDGRPFSDDDRLGRPGAAVINEALARTIDGPAIGRHIKDDVSAYAWGKAAPDDFVIVGIVEDERFRGLEEPSRPAFYLSTNQFPQADLSLVVRTAGDPAGAVAEVRAAVRRAAPRATVDHVTPLGRILADQLATRRTTTSVVSIFGVGALALAGLGLYGLMAVSVADRRREFGVRVALGAAPSAIASGIVRSGWRWTSGGVAAGIALSIVSGRLIAGLLVGVSAWDPLTLVLVAGVLFAVTTAATLVPALRAARVDPASVLRAD